MKITTQCSLLLFFGLFALPAFIVNATPLRDCTEMVCSEIFHNKELGKATAIVWRGQGNIVTSHTFDLDSSAELVHQGSSVSENYYSATNDAPAAPCPTGSCSAVRATTYETVTDIITVTVTFTYFNGQLIDADVQRIDKNKPPEMEG